MKSEVENIAAEILSRKGKIKILFVCLGNICRSPAAEGIMLDEAAKTGISDMIEADSAGTGRYHIGQLPDQRMRSAARRRGINLTHRCRQVTTDDFFNFDLIFGMDHSNLANLHALSPTSETDAKIHPFASLLEDCDHIPDPYYEGTEGFELVLDLLRQGCRRLASALTPA